MQQPPQCEQSLVARHDELLTLEELVDGVEPPDGIPFEARALEQPVERAPIAYVEQGFGLAPMPS